jgi:Fic family protein
MPARHHRAEKKKKRSKDAAHKSKARSKAVRPASKQGGSSSARKPIVKSQKQAPVSKTTPAKKAVATRPAGKGVEPKAASAAVKTSPVPAGAVAKGKPPAAVATAKTKPGMPAKASPVVARESGVGKGGALAKGGAAGAAAKAGSGKEAAAKTPKEARRSTVRPAPPLKPYKFIGVPSFTGPKPAKYTIPPPPPLPPPPPPASLEERVALLQGRLSKQDETFQRRYLESFDMSWIYHDSALEGVVYSFQELKTAIDSSATVVQDSSLQPVCEEIRRHKQAIEFVRDFATKKRLPITLDVIKRIYLILHPEEGDLKTLKYRKDIPQHRLYFHEYAPPDKIAYKVRQIVDWINDPETKRGRNALRIAARAHYDLLRVFPFAHDSGKVGRLLMNMLLMRAGYEPAIIHSTERQRYYEALKGSAAVILHMVQEAEENGLASIEKLLEEHETNTRSFVS